MPAQASPFFSPMNPDLLDAALTLIAATPGYEAMAADLSRLRDRGRIRFAPDLSDRAHAGLLGALLLGPEVFAANSALSLAETLVHEHHHLFRQPPLLKTVSFWAGVATRTPTMARYERPAYDAALDFLAAVARAHPDLADEAATETSAVEATFAANYESDDG